MNFDNIDNICHKIPPIYNNFWIFYLQKLEVYMLIINLSIKSS